jgi:hypothetical protein
MRSKLPFLLLAPLAACGSGGDNSGSRDSGVRHSEEASTAVQSDAESADSRAPSAPNVGVTAASGVAFNYRYGFRLPGQRIAQIQEQHAQACEKLGIDRCRITGMKYRLVNDSDIEAMLAFKLDPAIARQFGKNGADLVQQAQGMLVESEITGEDVGTEIVAAARNEAALGEDLARIEERLKQPKLGSSERTELQIQAQQLRESIRGSRTGRAEKQETLAKTPVVFNYGSGDLAPGFDERPSIGKALARAGDNVVEGFAAILLIAITLIPWALLLALLIVAWRLVAPRLRRFINGPQPEAMATE